MENWEAAGSPASPHRPGEGEIAGRMPVGGQLVELPCYSVFMPMEGFEGDLDSSVLYCGESCSLISDVRPAAELVRSLAADADAIREGTPG